METCEKLNDSLIKIFLDSVKTSYREVKISATIKMLISLTFTGVV